MSSHVPPIFIFYAALSLVLAAVLWRVRKSSATMTFGGFFFLVTIFPVLQLIPLIGYELAYEHFTYIPSIGITYLVSEALFRFHADHGRVVKVFLALILIAIIGLFSTMTWQRCTIWKDSLRFWNEVLRYNPDVAVAYNNRGNYYKEKGDSARALQDYNDALRVDPNYAKAYHNRGALYFELKDDDRALSDFNEALSRQPSSSAYSSRGFLLTIKGNYERAFDDFGRSLMLDPGDPEICNNRGVAWYARKEYGRAVEDFCMALKLNPSYSKAHMNWALAYYMLKDYMRAREEVKSLEKLGQQPDPAFMENLSKASGKSL
jgi:tetratricopeptide (TPR) repeat protein